MANKSFIVKNGLICGNLSVNTSAATLGNLTLSTSDVKIGNSTVNAVANTTQFSLFAAASNATLTTSLLAIANSTVNISFGPAGFFIGNSTVNTIANSSTLTVGANVTLDTAIFKITGTSNATINTTSLYIGNTTSNLSANATQVNVGNSTSNGALSYNQLYLGNTTANATVNTTYIGIGTAFTANSTVVNATSYNIGTSFIANSTLIVGAALRVTGLANVGSVNTLSVSLGANVALDTGSLMIGNSTANSVTNSTAVTVQSASGTGSLLFNTLSLGSSTANLVANSTFLKLANSTATANLSPSSLAIGAITVNTTNFVVANTLVQTVLNVFGFGAGNGTVNTFLGQTRLQISDASSTANLTSTALTIGSMTVNSSSVVVKAGGSDYRGGTDDTKCLTTNAVYQAVAEVTLTDAATIAVDLSSGYNFVVTLGGNRTLGNPTNVSIGKCGRIRIKQDATGSRTLSYGSNWKFPSNTAPTLSTAASKEDFLDYEVVSSTRIRAALTNDIPT